MKHKTITTLLLAGVLSVSALNAFIPVHAATIAASTEEATQDFHMDKDGKIRIRQVKVFQVSGTSFYLRYYVGQAFIRILAKTDTHTKVFRKFGDEIAIDQIVAGDILNIEGEMENGADTLSVVATKITNFSNQKEITGFKGSIVAMGSTTESFILATKSGNVTLVTGPNTQIKKGSRIIPPNLVKIGDTITDVVGTYDHATRTIDANVVVVYVNKKIFVPRNFEGTLKTIVSSNPASLIVNTEGKDYTVMLTGGTEILNKARKSTSLKRYLENDTVRFYGAIREAEEPIIDAELVRNISLQ
ncbi:MAG: hypothetical protein AAB511_04515 [Patescibacteria group bacterium]